MVLSCAAAVIVVAVGAQIVGAKTASDAASLPNIIVVQPDDFPMLEHWNPAHHSPGNYAEVVAIPGSKLPNIEQLRTEGVQMMQAYTASAMCGTSRYSTMTGRYPSRSSFNRNINFPRYIANVVIPETKLQDVSAVTDGNDCSENNVAAVLQQNGYETGFVGKWHLLDLASHQYDYSSMQNSVKTCGFDFAESVYAENLHLEWNDGSFSHNMEYMTSKAIEFIETSSEKEEPFFLYFNPTSPHSSGSVHEALTTFSCQSTPAGYLNFTAYSVNVKGYNVQVESEEDCQTYRQTVLERAEGLTDNVSLGTIWVDDAIGALLQTLKDTNQYENTLILFQMDHGQEGKSTLWEPGIRIAQFVKLPNQQQPIKFEGMVSTIDVAPTLLDYAGVDEFSVGYYEMDGISWREALMLEGGVVDDITVQKTAASWNTNRCLFFEMEQDRAVRCGCYKYMSLRLGSLTSYRGRRSGYATTDLFDLLVFDMCDGGRTYDHSQLGTNPERVNVAGTLSDDVVNSLMVQLHCHIENTFPRITPVYETCGPDTLAHIGFLAEEPALQSPPEDPAHAEEPALPSPPDDPAHAEEPALPSPPDDPGLAEEPALPSPQDDPDLVEEPALPSPPDDPALAEEPALPSPPDDPDLAEEPALPSLPEDPEFVEPEAVRCKRRTSTCQNHLECCNGLVCRRRYRAVQAYCLPSLV